MSFFLRGSLDTSRQGAELEYPREPRGFGNPSLIAFPSLNPSLPHPGPQHPVMKLPMGRWFETKCSNAKQGSGLYQPWSKLFPGDPQGLGFFSCNQDRMVSIDQVNTCQCCQVPPCRADCTYCLPTFYGPEHPSDGTSISALNLRPHQATVLIPRFAGKGCAAYCVLYIMVLATGVWLI